MITEETCKAFLEEYKALCEKHGLYVWTDTGLQEVSDDEDRDDFKEHLADLFIDTGELNDFLEEEPQQEVREITGGTLELGGERLNVISGKMLGGYGNFETDEPPPDDPFTLADFDALLASIPLPPPYMTATLVIMAEDVKHKSVDEIVATLTEDVRSAVRQMKEQTNQKPDWSKEGF